MQKSEKTRERILESTLALMREGGHDLEALTIRGIAERAGVSVGLINHHFGSKEKLVEQCVQRIIGGVISAFTPSIPTADPVGKLQCVAKQVADFLMNNPAISRQSILGDLAHPEAADNTMRTAEGFARRFAGAVPNQADLRRAFLLTAILQVSFLRKETLADSIGIDFFSKPERDAYIDAWVEQIYGNRGDGSWIES